MSEKREEEYCFWCTEKIDMKALKDRFSDLGISCKPLLCEKCYSQNGRHPLRFASNEIKSNRDIILDTVKQQGKAIIFADPKFLKDKEIIKESLLSSDQGSEIYRISDELLKNDETLFKLSINYFNRKKKQDEPEECGRDFEDDELDVD